MSYKKHISDVLKILDEYYYTEEIPIFLNHETPFQLLVATILSAQCTDDRVNIVTETLFKKYPTPKSLASADLEELEQDIKSTGFYKNKAKNLLQCANTLVNEFNSEVPTDIESLTTLAGVGRKTANVVPLFLTAR